MVPSAAGAVILIPFPFSDLSRSKLRPAVVLADAGRGDWILCQITSKPYADPRAVPLSNADFQTGSLRLQSYARPGKLFIAHQQLIVDQVGKLTTASFSRVLDAVLALLRPASRQQMLVELAARHNRIVITKDTDFVSSRLLTGRPSSLFLAASGNMGNAKLQRLLEDNIAILEDALSSHRVVELGRDCLVIHA